MTTNPNYSESTASDQDISLIATALGRTPRGVKGVAVRDATGRPVVVRVASVVAEQPFPTLFWLVCPRLNLVIDKLEAAGVIAEVQAWIGLAPGRREGLLDDHRVYAQLRSELMPRKEREWLAERGLLGALLARGVGGVADFSYIKCLHTFYAAHLVLANQVGARLEARYL